MSWRAQWFSPRTITRMEGRFSDFAQAQRPCRKGEGYLSSDTIAEAERQIEKIIASCRRDPASCPSTVAHLLAAFGMILAGREQGAPVRVLDFGGGLGAMYHRLGKFLALEYKLEWHVVETTAMAGAGRQRHQQEGLRFFTECPGESYDVVLAVGSLQYVENPRSTWQAMEAVATPYRILDIVPWTDEPADRLAVQVLPGERKPSYPAWILSRAQWSSRFEAGHRTAMKWVHRDPRYLCDGDSFAYEGCLLERKA